MSNKRELFEKNERVKSILNKYNWFFDFPSNQYVLESHYGDLKCAVASNYLDGLWYMWQELSIPDNCVVIPKEPEFETMQNMNKEFIENEYETPKYRMQQVYKAIVES